MLRPIKPTITALALVALVAVSAMSAVETVRHRPGTRTELERKQLGNWLLSSEAKDDSLAERRQMARKAAAAFRQGFDWSQLVPDLSGQQRELLAHNFRELTQIWLLDRADDWHRRPRNRRGQTLDREVAALLNWRLPPTDEGAMHSTATDAAKLDRLRAEAAICLAGETADHRRVAFELLDAARGHILARGWMRWLPGGG